MIQFKSYKVTLTAQSESGGVCHTSSSPRFLRYEYASLYFFCKFGSGKKSQQVEGHNKIQKLLMSFYNLLKAEADQTETGDSSQPPEAALSTH